MTCIVYDGKSIAADRKVMVGSICQGYTKKIRPWSKGWYAITGLHRIDESFRLWLEEGKEFFIKKKDFEAFFTDGKKVYHVQNDFIPEQINHLHPWAIGSSLEAAEMLVREGYTAEQAVKTVAKYDFMVGGKIDVVKV